MPGKLDDFQSLSPQQVNSWPDPTPPTSINGEPLPGERDPDAFMLLARERFKLSYDATSRQRSEAEIDLRFSVGQQWDPDIENNRRAQSRPCLTINRIDGFLAHAVNSMRQANAGIKIIAAADGADKEIADVKQGIIRHIQVNSKAETVYDEAFRMMGTTGLAWMRVVDDWADPMSFDQELFIRWIPNPFQVYHDPFCMQPDWSDMRYAFVVEDMTRADFIARYGRNRDTVGLTNFQSNSDTGQYWFPGGKIRVAEYFHVEIENDVLCEMEDGTTQIYSKLDHNVFAVEKDDDGEMSTYLRDPDDDLAPGHRIGRARKCKVPVVYWARISGIEILQERKWKGRYIPLIPVIGNQTEVDGERLINGMVRYAREPQRMFNYMYSSFVETCALAPRSPFIAEINQIPDGAVKEMWQNFNTRPQAVLLYKAQVIDGTANAIAPPPMRQESNPPIAAFVEGLQMSDQNLKSIFRIFEASLGQRGPQESGLAINARKLESDTGIYNWADNFTRALCYMGTVLEDLLPYYYNTPGRVFNVTQEDDTQKRIVINQVFTENGTSKKFDLNAGGKYAVIVTTENNFSETQRQEELKGMIDILKVYPQGAQAIIHLLVKEMDFNGADKMSAQLEKLLPPQLREPDPNQPAIPPEVQQEREQMSQQIQMLSKLLTEATDKRMMEREKEQWETLRSQMKDETDIAVAEIKAASAEAQTTVGLVFKELQAIRDLVANVAAGTAQGVNGSPEAPPPPGAQA